MRNGESEDTRVCYGFRCVWWGGIEDVGTLGKDPNCPVPGCPHCGGPLMQVPSPKSWWDSVEAHEKAGHPGYRSFVEWQKGKCFPSYQAAWKAWEARRGMH